MLCRSPFVKDRTGKSWRWALVKDLDEETRRQLKLNSTPFPCGQCLPCRINRRRVWTIRMVFESFCHSASSFVTLTYDEDHLPDDGQLSKRDVQLYLKRLRKSLEPRKIRYYLAGEYGPQTKRPHYHAVLFGVHPVLDADAVNKAWQKGFCVIGQDCSDAAIQYVAGYVTKKITKKGDGQHPEFALMSRKPALGVPFLENIKSAIQQGGDAYAKLFDATAGGVPLQVRLGGRSYPLGRTLRRSLGLLLDKECDCNGWLDSQGPAVLECLRRAQDVGESFAALDEGRARRIKAKYKIYSKRDAI